MPIFSYYLCPFPFDNVIVCLEKLKTLFLFYEKINDNDNNFIIRCISIMDNYKYFPIFSDYVKSLFKTYYFIILRFPYKKFIKKLCGILRDNLKEVPRILPNMINLLRTIKNLNESSVDSLEGNSKLIGGELEINDKKMTFDEIHKYLLIKFSKFIARFNSYTKLNKYFELFIEIAKENSIQPYNLIVGLRNLYNAIQDMRNWKIEKNILEVCKYLLLHHDLEVMKQNKIDDLLYEIHQKSFDYGIRDKAKLYHKLVTNVEKPILNTFLELNLSEFNSLNISYGYIDLQHHLQNIVILEQSKEERLKAKIEDDGSAIFDENFKRNIMLLSACYNEDLSTYSQHVYNRPISPRISAKEINDLIRQDRIDKIIENVITPNDIMRLFINDDMIDDKNDAKINPKEIFNYDQEFTFSDNNLTGLLNNHTYDLSNFSNEQFLNQFFNDYYVMLNKNRFYIKLPINLFMNKNTAPLDDKVVVPNNIQNKVYILYLYNM